MANNVNPADLVNMKVTRFVRDTMKDWARQHGLKLNYITSEVLRDWLKRQKDKSK